jgi:hypothetical protein
MTVKPKEVVFRELTAAELEQVTGAMNIGKIIGGVLKAPLTLDVGGSTSSFGSSWGTDEAAGQRE